MFVHTVEKKIADNKHLVLEARLRESRFREDSGLPTLALAFALTLGFTILYLDFTF